LGIRAGRAGAHQRAAEEWGLGRVEVPQVDERAHLPAWCPSQRLGVRGARRGVRSSTLRMQRDVAKWVRCAVRCPSRPCAMKRAPVACRAMELPSPNLEEARVARSAGAPLQQARRAASSWSIGREGQSAHSAMLQCGQRRSLTLCVDAERRCRGGIRSTPSHHCPIRHQCSPLEFIARARPLATPRARRWVL